MLSYFPSSKSLLLSFPPFATCRSSFSHLVATQAFITEKDGRAAAHVDGNRTRGHLFSNHALIKPDCHVTSGIKSKVSSVNLLLMALCARTGSEGRGRSSSSIARDIWRREVGEETAGYGFKNLNRVKVFFIFDSEGAKGIKACLGVSGSFA
ncbi:hypothetical protein EJ02DRAFT_221621 [Clathrospora elynae]|uniref:Uncharacterized protein n=1 Tax=Clathrospora elynae TaxID=706981 RepID=A0A6A5SMC7_9PLEO|nr:hypothetical protein EJ02DRAFT_221621 [Clathrospora elynae]